MVGIAQTSFYTDRAVGVFPLPGGGGRAGLIPIQYGQVRVCGSPAIGSPCVNTTTVTDLSGATLPIVGGNFGQLTTDIVGRFSFGCTAGNYVVQVAASSSNVPQLSYPITCPLAGGSAFDLTYARLDGTNQPFTGNITVPQLALSGAGTTNIFNATAGATTGIQISNGNGTGFFAANIQMMRIVSGAIFFNAGQTRIGSGGTIGWSSNAIPDNAANDTAFSRTGVKTVAVGNGTPGDVTGFIQLGGGQFTATSANGVDIAFARAGATFGSTAPLGFSAGIATAAPDSGVSRLGVGILGFGNGTQGDFSGTAKGTIFNAVTGYQINGAATANTFLKSNGTNYVAGNPTLASADFANQGTTITVLHGNAAGNPSFGVMTPSDAAGNTSGSGNFALTTSPVFVTPTLGVALATSLEITANNALILNEGTAPTGITAKDLIYGDATGHRLRVKLNNAGQDTLALLSDPLSVFSATTSSQLATVLSDETGTGLAVFNNAPALISPSTTGTDSGTETLTNKTLGSPVITGTILGAAATPITIQPGAAATQILNLNTAGGTQAITFDNSGNILMRIAGSSVQLAGATSGTINLQAAAVASGTITVPAGTDTLVALALTQTLTNKRVAPRVVTVTNAATLTPDGDNSDVSFQNNTQAAGTLTVAAPSGTPTDGQKLIIRVKSTNAQTYSFNATYRFSTITVAPTTLAAGKTDYLGAMWNATDSKWDVVAVDQGH